MSTVSDHHKLQYSTLERGNYHQWYLESSAYHSTRRDWLWMQEDKPAIEATEDVRMPDVIINAARDAVQEIKDEHGTIVQEYQASRPERVREGALVELGRPAVPFRPCLKTRILRSTTTTDNEKFEALDEERQVCATIRLHISPSMRRKEAKMKN